MRIGSGIALCGLMLPALAWGVPKTNYVWSGATGLNNGTSWANAYTSLQSGLSPSASGDQVWVAAGTYKPGTLRTDKFSMRNGVKIYGGFWTNMTQLSQRNWDVYPTILSGDIDNDGLLDADNTYHVVAPVTGGMMDGFFIQLGYANGAAQPDYYGGALCANGLTFGMTNCCFVSNYASNAGGPSGSTSATP